MSYSLDEPEWRPICQCTYDEARDEIDRGNCEIHCGMEEGAPPEVPLPGSQAPLRKPAMIQRHRKVDAT